MIIQKGKGLIKTDTLVSSTDVYNLALNCADKYGDPVYQARSLIRSDSTINYFNDDDMCNYVSPRSDVSLVNTGYLFPNPAENSITIAFDQPVTSIQIFDISGRLISVDYKLSDLRIVIDISNLPVGLYFVKGFNAVKLISQNKFVITR